MRGWRFSKSMVALTLIGVNMMGSPIVHAKTPVVSSSTVTAPQVKVLFSPDEDVQFALVRSLNAAQKQILVQAYLLTDDKITNALIAAHRRKVDVRVLLDAERVQTSKGSDAVALAQAGIPVKLETRYENAHNKIMLIDAGTANATIITGSYNFTYTAATKNAENVLFIRNAPDVMRRYVGNWLEHAKAAELLRIH